jgi:hypothetical protein
MPKKKVEKVHLTITVDADLNEWLEKTAAEFRLNKSQLINNLISIGKDDVGLIRGMGLLGAAKVLRNIKQEILKAKRKDIGIGAIE